MSDVVAYSSGYPATLRGITTDLSIWVRLYTNDPDLQGPRVASDFVEPVFAGYAGIGVRNWTPPMLRSGRAFTVTDPLYWSCPVAPFPLPIHGWYATVGQSGPLLWAWRRPDPAFQFSTSDPLLTLILTLYYPPL